MDVFTDRKQFQLSEPSAIALGFFDGVHLGHRAVLRAAAENPDKLHPAVFTFREAPRSLLSGQPVGLLVDFETKLELISQLGIRTVFAADFSEFREMDARSFFRFLTDDLSMKRACYGANFRFGADARGDETLMWWYCRTSGIVPDRVQPVMCGGITVSSTEIRRLLTEGRIEQANEMLGRAYCLTGTVLHGRGLGRQLGFATLNQTIRPELAPVRYGVYSSRCSVDGKLYPAVTNYGPCPTAMQYSARTETHIIGYEGDLYDENIPVYLLRYLRPQIRFENMEQLTAQIAKDVEASLRG